MEQLTFQSARLHEPIGPVPFRVDDHFVKGFAFAVDDWSAPYFAAPGQCGPLAHSDGIAKKLLHLFAERYDPQGIRSVHLKEDIWFEAPVRFGDELQLSGRYVDKFVRKGRPTLVLESEARDGLGNILVRQRSVEMVPSTQEQVADTPVDPEPGAPGLSSRRVNGHWPEAGAVARLARVDLAPDTRLPVLRKTIQQDQIAIFCGANENWKNLHTDLQLARDAGFDTTIMSGMVQLCWFTEMLVAFFGPGFLSGGRIGASFLAPVANGETIDCYGVVRSVAADGAMEIELWSRNQAGKLTCGGWATGTCHDR